MIAGFVVLPLPRRSGGKPRLAVPGLPNVEDGNRNEQFN
jgi:hypothetical protein